MSGVLTQVARNNHNISFDIPRKNIVLYSFQYTLSTHTYKEIHNDHVRKSMKNPEMSEGEGEDPRVTRMSNTCQIPHISSKTSEQHLSREL